MVRWRCFLVFVLLLAGCGISKYPGQPGVLTNNYSKIDFENLGGDGLYVYETSYDNRQKGPGMGAIVTKYHPGALTYTSNVRTNSDGTLYRTKSPYNDARVEMISLPQQNQILLPPNSTVLLYAEYELSLDEVDDKNLAEADLFTPSWTVFNRVAREVAELKRQWMAAASIGPRAELQYRLKKISLGEVAFEPSKPILLTTTFSQNGLQAQPDREILMEFVEFFEANFANGYKGKIKFETEGGTGLSLPLGLHTRNTALASGIQVVENASAEVLNAILKKFETE